MPEETSAAKPAAKPAPKPAPATKDPGTPTASSGKESPVCKECTAEKCPWRYTNVETCGFKTIRRPKAAPKAPPKK